MTSSWDVDDPSTWATFLPSETDPDRPSSRKPVKPDRMTSLVELAPRLAELSPDERTLDGLARLAGVHVQTIRRALQTDRFFDGHWGLDATISNIRSGTKSQEQQRRQEQSEALAELEARVAQLKAENAALRLRLHGVLGLDDVSALGLASEGESELESPAEDELAARRRGRGK